MEMGEKWSSSELVHNNIFLLIDFEEFYN